LNLDVQELALAFATACKPGGHGFGEALRLDSKASFYKTIGEWECVVEFGLAGKVTHAEVIEPVERAQPALAACNYLDSEFPGVHKFQYIAANVIG
jgi:hypothetical protein